MVNVDVDVPTAQGRQQLLRRIAHYRNAPPVPVEFKALEESKGKRPSIIESEAHEALEQAYVEAFDRTRAALVEIEQITNDSALTMTDLARSAMYLHDGILRLRASADSLSNTEDLYTDIAEHNIRKHFSKVECAVCREERIDASNCSECFEGGVCVECFSRELSVLKAGQWEDRAAVTRLAEFRCHNCPEGHYDSRLFNLLPCGAQALHRKVVEETSRLNALDESRMERCRELTSYTADGGGTYMDKLFKMERLAIGNLVSTRCPTCAMEFYDFRECCALHCVGCGTHFCALCLHGEKSWTVEVAHLHVFDCSQDAIGAEGVFMKLEDWMVHNQARQFRMCRDYLAKTDLPGGFKKRLQAAFPRPTGVR